MSVLNYCDCLDYFSIELKSGRVLIYLRSAGAEPLTSNKKIIYERIDFKKCIWNDSDVKKKKINKKHIQPCFSQYFLP